MTKKVKFLTTILIFLILGGGAFFYRSIIKKMMADQKTPRKETYLALLDGAEKIRSFWFEGNPDTKEQCESSSLGNYHNIAANYLRCNLDYLKCKLNKELPFKIRNTRISLGLEKIKLVKDAASSSKGNKIRIHLKTSGKEELETFISLEDNCHEVYLPQRIYAHGPYPQKGKKNDWRWDNLKRDIFIDRYFTSNRDINEWIKLSPQKENKKLKLVTIPKLIPKAAINLLPKQMEAYCAFRGKTLLESHVLDAASFYFTEARNQIGDVKRGPYPRGRKKNSSYLHQARTNPQFVFKNKFCKDVFTKECVGKKEMDIYRPTASSKIGINFVLGGHLEYVRNILAPKRNLMASSFYFDSNSSWHQLGQRAFWDGEGFLVKNIDWFDGEEATSAKFQIGFRCMRELM